MIKVLGIVAPLNLHEDSGAIDWGLDMANLTVTKALGTPVRKPEAKTTSRVGTLLMSSSLPWRVCRNSLIIPLEPNCSATCAPMPRRGDRDPKNGSIRNLCRRPRSLRLGRSF